jgi:hypothetical protein
MKYHRLETHRKLYLHNLPLKIEQLYNYIAKISDYFFPPSLTKLFYLSLLILLVCRVFANSVVCQLLFQYNLIQKNNDEKLIKKK